ncbi:MAG TPA: TolC family protein [Planctomycetota bacterium]|nr:TolC family protein [Planctomycetota bacterium]
MPRCVGFLIVAAAALAITGCAGTGNPQIADQAAPVAQRADAFPEGDSVPAGSEAGTVEPPAPDSTQAAADDSVKTIDLHRYRFGLEQAIRWAMANNISLLNARDQVSRSRFNVRAAAAEFEVKITPQANVGLAGGAGGTNAAHGAGLELSRKSTVGTAASVSGTTSDSGGANNTTNLGITLTQPLLYGLGKEVNKDPLLDAEFGVLTTERSYVQFQENLTVSVVRSFYEIVKQRELLELSRKSAERTSGHVAAAKAREKVGLASRIDVLRGEIQLRQAEDALLSAEQAYGDAVDNLRVLLGFGPQDDVEIDADLAYTDFAIDTDRAIEMAMFNRLDLAQARDEIIEAERNLRVAKNRTLPQLDLVLGYNRYGVGSSFSESSSLSDSSWTIGLSTATDVRRTAERAYYEQSKLDLESRERNNRLMGYNAAREVKDGIRRMEKNRKRIDVQQAEIDLARQKLRLARMKFERGLGDNFDLVTAEEELLRAESNHVAAVTDYIVSQVEVKKAIGTLVEKPERLK